MIYLQQFTFPDKEMEYDFILGQKKTCYDTYYPFQILSKHELCVLDLEPVTILYGGNGSGKTTALNVIAQKIEAKRGTRFNRSNFFEDYTHLCGYKAPNGLPEECRIITSDDVFDFMLDLRCINEGIDQKREELFDEYTKARTSGFQMRSIEDYEKMRKVNTARSKSKSKYIRQYLNDNVREHSNGESAYLYFEEKIKENGLYLLDEPENSLSPVKQQELLKLLEDRARFFQCQFIIATHSPFLLSMRQAKIYDLDEEIVDVKKWTQLENVKRYFEFFKSHEREFEQRD